jgi:hypothetical protein
MQGPTVHAKLYCLSCQYSLAGLIEHRCPECGRRFDPSDRSTFGTSPHRIVRQARSWRTAYALAILAPIEFICAAMAYHTIGEGHSILLVFAAIVGNALVVLLLVVRLPRVALGILILIAVSIIPRQLVLMVRMEMLRHEARQLVRYLEDTKAATGAYPANLSGYTFRWPDSKRHFRSYKLKDDAGGYIFHWYIGTPTASHWYSPQGGWGYYPD